MIDQVGGWSPSSVVLVAITAVFLLFLVFRALPIGRGRARADLRAAQATLRKAKAPRAKAEALFDLALLTRAAGGPRRAASFVTRALRADPSWEEAWELAAKALRGRPHLLERVVLRRVGTLDWKGPERASVAAAFDALAKAYGRTPLERARGELYAKLAAELRG